ncbi:MAG: hypothetical protein HY536_00765 [Candidatus Colwellbacteria bacterium]|nr:hypothetical protein [Candidatus Colwellbacteria bacterium]
MTHGQLMLCDVWSRWYVYLSKDGRAWGASSDDHSVGDATADEITKQWPAWIRRKSDKDERRFPFCAPYFVIDRATPEALVTFVKIIKVLATTDPSIEERRKRREARQRD